MPEQVLYQAKVPCRVGGVYRRAEEVFLMPEFKITPPYLVRVEPGAEAAAEKTAQGKQPKAATPGPMPADLPGVVRD